MFSLHRASSFPGIFYLCPWKSKRGKFSFQHVFWKIEQHKKSEFFSYQKVWKRTFQYGPKWMKIILTPNVLCNEVPFPSYSDVELSAWTLNLILNLFVAHRRWLRSYVRVWFTCYIQGMVPVLLCTVCGMVQLRYVTYKRWRPCRYALLVVWYS